MQNFKTEIAKECWLMEGVYYLGMNYISYAKYVYHKNYDGRYEKMDWRRSGDIFQNENECVDAMDIIGRDLSEFVYQRYKISPHPAYPITKYEHYEKYNCINHYTSVEGYEDTFRRRNSYQTTISEEENKSFLEERELVKEYCTIRDKFYNEVEKLNEDCKMELYLLIKKGKVSINGFLSSATQESGLHTVDCNERKFHDFEIHEYNGIKYYDLDSERDFVLDREEIHIEGNLLFDAIKWEDNALFTKDGKYYINVLISFDDLYKEKPQQLEYEIVAKLLGNRIVYNEKTYQEITENSTKGRKSFEWDLFYAELFRYIIQNEKSILPHKQDSLIIHMQNWCKNTGFSTGSRGSIQPKISAIYNALQKVKK